MTRSSENVSDALPPLLAQLDKANAYVMALNQRRLDLLTECAALRERQRLGAATQTQSVATPAAELGAARRKGPSKFLSSILGETRTPAQRIRAHVDSLCGAPWQEGAQIVRHGRRVVTLEGWMFVEPEAAQGDLAISLLCGSLVVPANVVRKTRLDLVNHFQRADLTEAGFFAQAPIGRLDGDVELLFEVRNGSGVPSLRQGRFKVVV